jgi:hypothetical protein
LKPGAFKLRVTLDSTCTPPPTGDVRLTGGLDGVSKLSGVRRGQVERSGRVNSGQVQPLDRDEGIQVAARAL